MFDLHNRHVNNPWNVDDNSYTFKKHGSSLDPSNIVQFHLVLDDVLIDEYNF